MSTELRCSNCDRVCRKGERYCSYCHEPIVTVFLSDGTLNDIPLEYWDSFIDNNADKYLEVFNKHKGKTWFRAFHFPAFWISVEWMIYRKMYWQAVVGWLVTVLFALGMAYLAPMAPAFVLICCPLLLIGLKIVFGMYAYAIYKQHCLRNLKRSLGSVANGGVTVFGAVAISALISLINTFLLEPLITAIISNRI